MTQEKRIFVGREKELQNFVEVAREALSGKAGMVFVTGRSGTGKTAFVEEGICRITQEYDQAVIVAGHCRSEGTAYGLFRSLLKDLLLLRTMKSVLPADQLADRTASIRNGVMNSIQGFGTGMREVFFLDVTKEILEEHESPLQHLQTIHDVQGVKNIGQMQLFGWYTQMIKMLAECFPLVLFLEDLHHADISSLNLLQYLSREILHYGGESHTVPILIIGTDRPRKIPHESFMTHIKNTLTHVLPIHIHQTYETSADALLSQISAEGKAYNVREISLDVNIESPDEQKKVTQFVHAYLKARYETTHFPNWFEEFLIEMSEGNPLFLIEALIDFEEKGWLKRSASEVATQAQESELIFPSEFDSVKNFPETVEDIFRKRVRRLQAPLREVLENASVQGHRFLLEAIPGGPSKQEGVEMLRELKDHKYLLAEELQTLPNGTPVHIGIFRYPLLREYLYRQLSPERKMRLHADTGRALERLHRSNTGGIVVELAEHFYHGALADKAISYCLQAAEEANLLRGMPEAIRFAVMGLKILEDQAVHFSQQTYAEYKWRLLLKLARAEEIAGDKVANKEHFETGIAYLEDHLPVVDVTKDALHAAVYGRLGTLYARQGEHPEKARQYLEQALYIYEELGEQSHIAEILFQLAAVFPAGESLHLLERSLSIAEQISDLTLQLTCLSRLAERYAELDFSCAEDYVQQAWHIVTQEKSSMRFWEISILTMMAAMDRENGRFRTGIQRLESALELARKSGDLVAEAAVLNDLGFDYGRYVSLQEQARQHLEASIAIRDRVGLDKSAPSYNLGWLLTRQGRWKEAEESFQLAIIESSERNQAMFRGSIGALHESRENYAQAEMELLYRVEVLETSERSPDVFGYTGLALSFALTGDETQSLHYLEIARKLFEEETRPRKKWWGVYEIAEVYRILHDYQLAETLCKEAIQWFLEYAEDAEDFMYLAKARFVMGKVLVDTASYQEALTYLGQAKTTFELCHHYLLGEILLYQGKAYHRLGDEQAKDSLNQALAEFQRLELHHKADEAKKLLAALAS